MDRLTQATQLEKQARAHEAHGRAHEAFREYRAALEVYAFVEKWEANPRIKAMVRERLDELLGRAEALKGGRTADCAVSGGGIPQAAAGAVAAPGPPIVAEAGGDGGTLDAELRNSLAGCILAETPGVRWDDVAGLQAAKEALQETVILPSRFPQLFRGKREPWHGILMYGPPGTGKSHLAKACATEADATFLSVSSSDMVSKWMGESEKLVRGLFELARERRPAVIFIDEVDSLCGARGQSGESEAARRIKTEFLAQMDGVGRSKAQVLVLGATNTPWDLDTAIRRRFEKRVYIPLPDTAARARLLELSCGDTPHCCSRAEWLSIARRTEGFSGADISVLVRDAIYEPVRRCRAAVAFKRVAKAGSSGLFWTPCQPGEPGATPMTLMQVRPEELLEPDVLPSDLEAALRRVRPSVGAAELLQHEAFTKMYGEEGGSPGEAEGRASSLQQLGCGGQTSLPECTVC